MVKPVTGGAMFRMEVESFSVGFATWFGSFAMVAELFVGFGACVAASVCVRFAGGGIGASSTIVMSSSESGRHLYCAFIV